MHVIGIICEYNPFHNGHLYHINKCKELYPESVIILVLNGYFLQRGELSILTKEDKTKIALKAGIDLVIELPLVFGTQAADIFAYNSIKLLHYLHVDRVVFGSESNDINVLERIVELQQSESYNSKVKGYLDKGDNYPTAMAKALNIDFEFNNPNDLLGISYIKAIKCINPNIKYETIKRTNSYHDLEDASDIVSASNIRNKIMYKEDVKRYMPDYSFKCLKKFNNDYFNFLKQKIITEQDLSIYLSVDEGIENRLKSVINDCTNLEILINKVKTKRYTYNKINRMFIHILIGLTKEDNKILEIDYIRILGFNNTGKEYLKKIKKNMEVPIYSNKLNSKIKDYELKASLIYDLITGLNTYRFEINNKPVN